MRKTPDLDLNTEISGLKKTHRRNILFWLRGGKGPPGSLSEPTRSGEQQPCKLWSNLENPTHSQTWYIDYSPCSQCLSGDFRL